MNKDQAAALVMAINDCARYVPPMIFERVAGSVAMQMIVSVANGQLELVEREPDKRQPPLRPVNEAH
jgi:hypothetical protein